MRDVPKKIGVQGLSFLKKNLNPENASSALGVERKILSINNWLASIPSHYLMGSPNIWDRNR